MLTSVSIVAAPWRALTTAARWNGQAPQTTTGEASVRTSHCQLSNCSGVTIDSSRVGTASAVLISARWRSDRVSGSSRGRRGGGVRAAGGAGRTAP